MKNQISSNLNKPNQMHQGLQAEYLQVEPFQQYSQMQVEYSSSSFNSAQINKQKILTSTDKSIINQVKKLGLNFTNSQGDRDQFTSILSGAVSNFFTFILKNLSKKNQYNLQQLDSLSEEDPIHKYNNSKTSENQLKKVQNISLKNNDLVKVEQLKKENSHKLYTKNEHQNIEQNNKASKKIKKLRISRSDEQRKILKNMEQNYNCRLRNNRLYMQGMPKKPVSSFFFFFKQQSKRIQGVNQHIQGSKQSTYGSVLARSISQKWANMTAEEKQPYIKLSQQTRQKYKSEMQKFKKNNSQVYESFKRIKRIKANQTRKRKNQRNQNPNQIQEQQVQENQSEQNSQSIEKNDQEIEQDLAIMIPEQQNQKQQTNQRSSKIRFKSQHKPKSPVPSFFFFYNQKKQEIGKQYGVKTGAQIAKYASKIWKQMTQQQKQPFEQMADNRRKKYYEQMKRFQIDYPEEYALMMKHKRRNRSSKNIMNEENMQIINSEVQQQESEQNKPDNMNNQNSKTSKRNTVNTSVMDNKSITHRPKAPVSSFFIFYKQNNSILAQQFKQAQVSKLVQYASSVWKKMSAQQKRPYEIRSDQSRKQYYKLMQEYKQKYPEQIIQRKLDLKKKHEDQSFQKKRIRVNKKISQAESPLQAKQLKMQENSESIQMEEQLEFHEAQNMLEKK